MFCIVSHRILDKVMTFVCFIRDLCAEVSEKGLYVTWS